MTHRAVIRLNVCKINGLVVQLIYKFTKPYKPIE